MLKRFISVFGIFLILSQNAFAVVWYVDSVADDDLNTCSAGEFVDNDNCTFRDAVSQLSDGDIIRFLNTTPTNFTDDNPLVLTSGISIDVNNVSIGGDDSGADANATTTVVIDGNGGAFDGITINGDAVHLEYLTLVGFDNALAVRATSDGSDALFSNFGTKSDGTTAPTNRNNTGALIQGTNFSFNAGNNISQNTGYGIEIDDTVQDLYIGGSDVIGNGGDGVKFVGSDVASFDSGDGNVEGITISRAFYGGSYYYPTLSDNNGDAISFNTATMNDSTINISGATIGGAGVANTGDGIDITTAGSGNTVRIGTDGDGLADSTEGNNIQYNANGVVIGDSVSTLIVAGNTIQNNTGSGVTVNGTGFVSVTIGGDLADESNNIGAGATGITIADAGTTPGAVTIQQNYIGFTDDGTTSAGIAGVAVSVADGAVVTIQDNVIGNSGDSGVSVTGGSSLTFLGNKIGTDATGIAQASVANYGLHINSSTLTSATIGGNTVSLGNVFAAASGASTGAGLYVQRMASNSSTVTVQGNYFGIGSDGISSTFMGNFLRGARFSYGAITFGGDNGLGGDGTGDLEEGNVVANSGTGECVLVDTANVSSFTSIGNIMGLKKGAVSGVYDTAAGNGDAVTDACINVDASALTTLVIGQGFGVGGSTITSRRNIISGNSGYAVDINNVGTTATSTIHNNYIGFDYLGVSDLGNGGGGIYINDGGSGGVSVGGTSGSQGNMIAGNGTTLATDHAVNVVGSSAFTTNINNNSIGLGAAGAAALANAGSGVAVSNPNATVNVGGGGTNEGNIISGNTGSGIYVTDGTVNIQGNIIGMNALETAAVPNGSGVHTANTLNYGGVLIEGGTVVVGTNLDGTTDAAEKNYISGNAGFGVGVIGATSATIAGNYIGLNGAGTGVVANSDGSDTLSTINGSGIAVYDATGNTVDGTMIGTSSTDSDDITNGRNYIAGNAGSGIAILHGGGTGQDWSSGYIKNNYFGVDTTGEISSGFENTDYSVVADSNSSATITGLSVGGSVGGDIVNNTDHVGVYVSDLTLSNASTMASDNTYTDTTTGPTYNNWEYYVASVLTDWDPVYQCNDGVDNDGDGETDYSQDDGCTGATDNDETDPQAGGSVAVAVSLATNTIPIKSETLVSDVVPKAAPVVSEPVVTKPVVKVDDVYAQESALKRAISPIVDILSPNVVDVDTVKQIVAQQVVEQAAEAEVAQDKSVEAQVVEKTINQILESGDETLTFTDKRIVSNAIENKTQDSLLKAVLQASLMGESVVAHVGGGRTVNVSNPANVEIISTFGLSEVEKKSVLVAKQKAEAQGKQVLVVDEKSDLAGDGVADIVKVAMDLPVFGANEVDDDGVKLSDEIWIGLNPKVKDGLPKKPIVSVGRVGALNSDVAGPVKSGPFPFVRIGGQPGDKVVVVAIDNNDPTNQIILGKVTIDSSGKAEIRPHVKLREGITYSIVAQGKEGFGRGDLIRVVSKTSTIKLSKVSLAGDLDANPRGGLTPTLKKIKSAYSMIMDALDNTPTLRSKKASKKVKKFSFLPLATSMFASVLSVYGPENYLDEVDPSSSTFVGEAEPGTIIVVTWKSIILSSTVVADASSGKFTLDVPTDDISDGNHEVMVFAYNPSKKYVSSLSTLKFKK